MAKGNIIKYWDNGVLKTVGSAKGSGTPVLEPLTFTGAVEGTYDGTAPFEVHIPTVDDVLAALPEWKWGAF